MIELAMVFAKDGSALFWLGPNGCTSGSVPDSHVLWDRIWRNREVIGGVAHTHPGDGPTGASHTDLTTFAAIESGLGKRLIWPIVSSTHVSFFQYWELSKSYVDSKNVDFRDMNHWFEVVKTLRHLSQIGG